MRKFHDLLYTNTAFSDGLTYLWDMVMGLSAIDIYLSAGN